MTTSLVFRGKSVEQMNEEIRANANTLQRVAIVGAKTCIDETLRMIACHCENLRHLECSMDNITPYAHKCLEEISEDLSVMILTHAEPKHVKFYKKNMRKFVLKYTDPYGNTQVELLRFSTSLSVRSLFVDISDNWGRTVSSVVYLMNRFNVKTMKFHHDMDESFVEPEGYVVYRARDPCQFMIHKRTLTCDALPLVYFGPCGKKPVVTQPSRVLMNHLSDLTVECLSGIEHHVKKFDVIYRDIAADVKPDVLAAIERCGLEVPVKA